jgi:predicted dehydrogenase
VTFNALICFDNGSTGVLLANWRTGTRLLKFEFHALGASAYVDADGDGAVWTDNQAAPNFSANFESFADSTDFCVTQGFLAEDRAFIDAVRSGVDPHNSLSDAVMSMRLADSIYSSAINPPGR